MTDNNAELISEVKELTRTLRGYNGNPGLLTEFALLRRDVHQIAAEIERINTEGCNANHINNKRKEGDALVNSTLEDRALTFKWMREKLVVPIVVSVIIALINGLFIVKLLVP